MKIDHILKKEGEGMEIKEALTTSLLSEVPFL